MGKTKLTAEGLNINQMYKNPFSYQYNYGYYEAKIYSMDTYFEGFNLRQLNKITFIFNQFALSYQSFMFLLENKKRANKKISERELKALESFDKVYSMVIKVNGFMRKFNNTSPIRYAKHESTFGKQYDEDMNGRCWIESVDKLKSMKFVRYVSKTGFGPTEEYYPKDTEHINRLNQNVTTFYLFGYWLEYFKIACFENSLSTPELEEFDIGIMNEMFNEALNLMKILHKLRYIHCFEKFKVPND